MAKGKMLTYLLIVCVAAVWGLIIYRVYVGIKEEDDASPMAVAAKVSYFKMINHQDDKFHLDLGYRDPFMSADAEPSVKDDAKVMTGLSTTTQQQSVRAPVPKPQVNWSSIRYIGYVNNPDTKQKMVLVSVNGNTAVLREGQAGQGIKLIKNLGDSIKVQFQDETKFIKIK